MFAVLKASFHCSSSSSSHRSKRRFTMLHLPWSEKKSLEKGVEVEEDFCREGGDVRCTIQIQKKIAQIHSAVDEDRLGEKKRAEERERAERG